MFNVPTVAVWSSVIVRATPMLLVRLTTSPAAVPGTTLGFQLVAALQTLDVKFVQLPLAAKVDLVDISSSEIAVRTLNNLIFVLFKGVFMARLFMFGGTL